MRPFLAGARVGLHATAARVPVGPGAWLDPGARAEGQDEIHHGVRQAGASEEAGVVGLTCVDWAAHAARLCGGGDALAPAERAEALRLAVRYAFDELNLDRLDAAPTGRDVDALLRALGFREAGPDGALRIVRAGAPAHP